SSNSRHTRLSRDWSSDVCSSDLNWNAGRQFPAGLARANQRRHLRVAPSRLVLRNPLRMKESLTITGPKSSPRRVGRKSREALFLKRRIKQRIMTTLMRVWSLLQMNLKHGTRYRLAHSQRNRRLERSFSVWRQKSFRLDFLLRGRANLRPIIGCGSERLPLRSRPGV